MKLYPILLSALIATGLHAAPARHPSYEPVEIPASSARSNLFLNAKVTASGHWDKQAPELAVSGNLDPDNHWACENLPVWHQVNLDELTEISAIRVWPLWGHGRIYKYKVEGSNDGKNWKILADMSANSIASTAEGNLFSFEPMHLKHVRTTFTGSSQGAANGGHLVQIEAYASAPNAALGGGVGTTDMRYPPHGPAGDLSPPEKGISLHAWRGERVNAQVVIFSEAAHQALRFEDFSLSKGDAKIKGNARFVRYTLADGKPQGDILDDAEQLDLPAGANRPVWLEIDVPAQTAAGIYTGVFTARSDTSKIEFPVAVEVFATTLPAPADWKFHLDIWQHPDAVARWHDVKMWSDEHFALLRPAMQRLAQAGQKTITTTLINEPWGAQTYDWFSSMITWHKRADGSWHYDYSIFDKWVTFMSEECGYENARIHGYSMIPWSLKFRYYDDATNSWAEKKLDPGTDGYDEFWGAFLRDFKKHLAQKGWLKRMRIAVDERPDHLVRGALATLNKHAPEILISSAIDAPSDLNRDLDDISTAIQHVNQFKRSLLDTRSAAQNRTTFYICTNPPTPNTFTFSPPAESEWMPLFAEAAGFNGMLRWAYHSWVENPLVSTDFVTWPSGDCFIVYPGDRSSIRFESLRDGIESFEKIRLLRAHAKKSSNPALQQALTELDKELEGFTWERGSKTGVHTDDVRRVNAILLKATRAITK